MKEKIIRINFPIHEMRILEWFVRNEHGTSKEIEHDLWLSQPLVCISIKRLIKLGYIREYYNEKKDGQGRPIKHYIVEPDWHKKLLDNLNEEVSRMEKVIDGMTENRE